MENKPKQELFPLFSLLVSISTLVFGLVFVKSESIMYFYIALTLLYLSFGYFKTLIFIIPSLIMMSLFFGCTTYFVAQNVEATTYAIFRSFAICFALIPSISTSTNSFVKTLRQINLPKSLTLGMLIILNFAPLLRKEMQQVRDAMKTRGIFGMFNLKIFYRAFLIPFMVRLVDISNTLSLSVETRGFTLEQSETTIFEPILIQKRDKLFLVLFILICIGVNK